MLSMKFMNCWVAMITPRQRHSTIREEHSPLGMWNIPKALNCLHQRKDKGRGKGSASTTSHTRHECPCSNWPYWLSEYARWVVPVCFSLPRPWNQVLSAPTIEESHSECSGSGTHQHILYFWSSFNNSSRQWNRIQSWSWQVKVGCIGWWGKQVLWNVFIPSQIDNFSVFHQKYFAMVLWGK